uniref:Uncharacterized protein n=1 Tax=Anguilla anguilla TaxID=7936 RepID=A0A0E9RRG7_ANGAN
MLLLASASALRSPQTSVVYLCLNTYSGTLSTSSSDLAKHRVYTRLQFSISGVDSWLLL